MSSYLALKLGYINKTHTHIHKVELKTLYFNFVWLLQNRFLLFILKNYLSLSVSRTVNQLIMQVYKPKVEYKLALQEKPQGRLWKSVSILRIVICVTVNCMKSQHNCWKVMKMWAVLRSCWPWLYSVAHGLRDKWSGL